jgi:hypothetical protein
LTFLQVFPSCVEAMVGKQLFEFPRLMRTYQVDVKSFTGLGGVFETRREFEAAEEYYTEADM